MNVRNISPLQFFFLAVNLSFGTSMLTLPRTLAEIAQEDMWLPVLLGCIPFMIAFLVSVKLAAYFPSHNAIEYHVILLGRIPGQVLNAVMLLLMLVSTMVFLRTFTTAVKIYLLDLTPPMVVAGLLLLPAIYVVQYGLLPVMRLQQFLFLPSYGLFTMVISLGVLSVDTRNYLPLLANGLTPVFQGVIPTWFNYTGPEFATALLYPFITRQQKVLKYGLAAIAGLAIFYLVMTIITQGILGAPETAHLIMPTVMAYRSVEIPDTFIERLDGYLMLMWIFLCFMAQVSWVYLISSGIGKMMSLETYRPIVVILAPILIYLNIVPNSIQSVEVIEHWVNYASIAWGLGVLPLLLALAWRRQRGQQQCE